VALTNSADGTLRPSAFAVSILITTSTLVGCSTGRSAGLAPLRILYISLINFTQKGAEAIKDGPKRLEAAKRRFREARIKELHPLWAPSQFREFVQKNQLQAGGFCCFF
jgi:hypothetical protein